MPLEDAFGDALPPGALGRCGIARLWHPSGTNFPELRDLSFSPDGTVLASAGGDSVRLWSVPDGRPCGVLSVPKGALEAVLCLRDDLLVAGGAHGRVSLWDLKTGTLQHVWELGCQAVHSLAVSPDGQTLVAGTWLPSGISVLDLPTRTVRAHLRDGVEALPPQTLCFSSDGVLLAAFERMHEYTRLCLWETTTWTRRFALRDAHGGASSWVEFLPGEQQLVAPSMVRWDEVIRIHDVQTGAVVEEHQGRQGRWAVLGDGMHAVIRTNAHYDGGEVALFQGTELMRRIPIPRSYLQDFGCLAVSADRQWLALSKGSAFLLVDLSTGRVLPTAVHRDGVTQVAFSPDGAELLTVSQDGTTRRWDCASGTQRMLHPLGETAPEDTLLYEGRALLQDHVGFRSLKDATSGRDVPLEGNPRVSGGAWAPGAPFLAYLEQEREHRVALVYDVRSGALVSSTMLPGGPRDSFCISRDGGLLATSELLGKPLSGAPVAIRVWALRTGGVVFETELPEWSGRTLRFSPDARTLAVAAHPDHLVLLDLQGGQAPVRLETSDASVSVAFSPDGQRVAAGGLGRVVRVWNRDGTLTHTLSGHSGYIHSVAFSPDGTRLASGSEDTTALIWQLLRLE